MYGRRIVDGRRIVSAPLRAHFIVSPYNYFMTAQRQLQKDVAVRVLSPTFEGGIEALISQI